MGSNFLTCETVQVLRYCTPWAIFGSVVSAIGSGLITTFTPTTGTGEWIGYQILVGTGRASVFQMVSGAKGVQCPKEANIISADHCNPGISPEE